MKYCTNAYCVPPGHKWYSDVDVSHVCSLDLLNIQGNSAFPQVVSWPQILAAKDWVREFVTIKLNVLLPTFMTLLYTFPNLLEDMVMLAYLANKD